MDEIKAMYEALTVPMPKESLKDDKGRGFALTSIRAAFVLERATEVFGLLGYGWRYAHSPHRIEVTAGAGPKGEDRVELLTTVCVQWRLPREALKVAGSPPVDWDQMRDSDGTILHGWYRMKDCPAVWSEPVFATGGSAANRKGSVGLTDAYRAATTNGITKCITRLGVALEIYKGENDIASSAEAEAKAKRAAAARKAKARKAAKAKRAAAKVKAPADAKNGFSTLEEMRVVALECYANLERVEDEAPSVRQLGGLTKQMAKVGLTISSADLIALLLGEVELSKRGIMAVINFLAKPQFTASNAEVLNGSKAM